MASNEEIETWKVQPEDLEPSKYYHNMSTYSIK